MTIPAHLTPYRKFLMKTYNKFTLLLAVAALLAFSIQVQAEEEGAKKLLTIGSPAPALDIENWISDGNGQFKKVTTFEKGKVYVVEFWATWCGPCVASMPHLSETQKRYADKAVQLISVSSEELETVENFLLKEVQGGKPGQTYAELTSTYCLTCDPDQSTSKDYMAAAGRNGIPCAFLVGKTGLIEWIGHPLGMDDALKQVVENSWDREAFAKVFKQKQLFESVIYPQVLEAYRGGDFEKAVSILDKALTELTEKGLVEQVTSMRQVIILHAGGDQAVQEVQQYVKKHKQDNEALDELGRRIFMMAARSQLDPKVVEAGIELAKQTQKNAPDSVGPLELLSHLYYISGNLDQAIETQKKAVAMFTAKKEDVPKQINNFLEEMLNEKKELAAKKEAEATEKKEKAKP